MATKKWFVLDGDDELGPLGPNGLRKLVKAGKVQPDTMVRREDHEYLVRADHVRGLFDAPPAPPAHGEPLPVIHGPFLSLRGIGYGVVAAMGVWMLVGLFGIYTALGQRSVAREIAAGAARPLADADAPFLGVGEIGAIALFLAAGVLFCYWLWCARLNLPHLISARLRFAPSWTLGAWIVPPLNLWRPFEVLDEVDRRSAEAAADGDASVGSQRGLLVPWWLCTLIAIGLGVWYALKPRDSAEALVGIASLHTAIGALVAVAAALAGAVALRITLVQERAHARHPEPVHVHHKRNHHRAEGAATG